MKFLREKICGIYSYRDLFNNYKIVYVGQSNDVYNRHRSHSRDKKNNQLIDKQIIKNDKRYVFTLEEICQESELNNLESKYINKYKPKYNIRAGGDYVRNRHMKKGISMYTLWDTSIIHYVSYKNQKRNKPFRMYYNGYYIPCGYFEDFITIEIIYNIIEMEGNNEIIEK